MAIYGKILNEDNLPFENLFNKNFYVENNFIYNINESDVDFDNIIDSFISENYLFESINILNESGEGSVDTKTIKDKTSTTAKSIFTYIKENGLGKATLDFITYSLDKLVKDVVKCIDITNIYQLKFSNYDFNKIKNAILLLVLTAVLNNLILLVIYGLAAAITKNPSMVNKLVLNLGTGVFGPMNEEFAKRVAIKGGFIVEFTAVLNTAEIISYTNAIVSQFSFTGLSKSVLIRNGLFARLKTATMHIATVLVQYLSSNEKFAKKLGLTQEQSELFGNTIGVIIHSAWNLLGINSKSFNKIVLGKTLGQYI